MGTESVNVPVRYEDDYLAVVDKPAGLVVHPGAGHRGPTLVDDLAARWPANHAFDHVRYGLVHRLDKDTSGLLLVAKSGEAYARLKELFATRRVGKKYVAIVTGVPRKRTAVIEAPVGRDKSKRTAMAVDPGGRDASTTYRVVSDNGRYARLEVTIASGRTHQIRVHLGALGHPVVGDAVYGLPASGVHRQLLHAAELTFDHPVTGEPVTVQAPVPSDFQTFIRRERL